MAKANDAEELPVPERGTPAIQAVERAATILGAFTVGRPRLSLSELTARLGTSKPTAHRYTKALRTVNLLRYDKREALYSLGPQVLTLSAAARAGLPIISIAGPFMEELVREANETVVLSVWDGDTAVVVRVDDNTDRTIRISVRPGARLSLTSSAQGRVFCVPADRRRRRAVRPPEEVGRAADRAREHPCCRHLPELSCRQWCQDPCRARVPGLAHHRDDGDRRHYCLHLGARRFTGRARTAARVPGADRDPGSTPA